MFKKMAGKNKVFKNYLGEVTTERVPPCYETSWKIRVGTRNTRHTKQKSLKALESLLNFQTMISDLTKVHCLTLLCWTKGQRRNQ